MEAIIIRYEAITIGLAAIAIRPEAITIRYEVITIGLAAVATRPEAIASRLEATAAGWRPSIRVRGRRYWVSGHRY